MITWLLVTLATYRLAYLVTVEDGPGDVFTRLRSGIYRRYGDNTWQTRGINCALCCSFWLAWLVALLAPWSSWQAYVLLALGAAGGVVVIHKVIERG